MGGGQGTPAGLEGGQWARSEGEGDCGGRGAFILIKDFGGFKNRRVCNSLLDKTRIPVYNRLFQAWLPPSGFLLGGRGDGVLRYRGISQMQVTHKSHLGTTLIDSAAYKPLSFLAYFEKSKIVK